MRNSVILLLCLVFSVGVFGQEKTLKDQINEKKIREIEVNPPQFTGLRNASEFIGKTQDQLIQDYLLQNVVYPGNALNCGKEGTEVVQFTVYPDGEVGNFRVINSVCPEIDKELIRVLNTTDGMWQPGNNNGDPVSMEKEVSVIFSHHPTTESIEEHFVMHGTVNFKNAATNLLINKKPKRALRQLNMGIRYLPHEKNLLLLRGLCNYELGDEKSAQKDWDRIAHLGGMQHEEVGYDLTAMKGYTEMLKALK